MKTLAIACVALSVLLSPTVYGRGGGGHGGMGGGMGMHSASSTGGAFGTSPVAPGTNSSGTALSSGGISGAARGPALGTGDPAIDREDRKAERMISSICKGC